MCRGWARPGWVRASGDNEQDPWAGTERVSGPSLRSPGKPKWGSRGTRLLVKLGSSGFECVFLPASWVTLGLSPASGGPLSFPNSSYWCQQFIKLNIPFPLIYFNLIFKNLNIISLNSFSLISPVFGFMYLFSFHLRVFGHHKELTMCFADVSVLIPHNNRPG